MLVKRGFYLGSIFERAAGRHGPVGVTLDRALDVAPQAGTQHTYLTLAALVDQLAARLWAAGVRPAEHVAVYKANNVDIALLACALSRIGAVPALLAPSLGAAVVGELLRRMDRPWLVSDESKLTGELSPAGVPSPVERVFHYEHPAVGGRTVLRVPFAGGFQIDLQCRDDDPPDAYGTDEAVRRWLPDVVGDGYTDKVLWVSTYRFLQLVAESFTDDTRRVLLAGEAAHLFPPFGARGLNSGIADAQAMARAIAAAVAGPATGPIDAYAAARRQAALFNSAAAGAALAHLRPRPLMRVRQRCAATLAPVLPRCGSWLEHAPYGPRHGSPADPSRRY